MTIIIDAVASIEFDLEPLWHNLDRGRQGWDGVSEFTSGLSDRFASVVGAVINDQSVESRAEMEIVSASLYGTAHVAEVMHQQIHLAGPKWINPEQFLYYSPHSMLSAAAVFHKIGGAGITLLGPNSSFRAISHAITRLSLGRSSKIIVAGYEALTPLARETFFGLGSIPRGHCTALLLSRAEDDGSQPSVADAADLLLNQNKLLGIDLLPDLAKYRGAEVRVFRSNEKSKLGIFRA